MVIETQKGKEQVNIELFPKLREMRRMYSSIRFLPAIREFNAMLKVTAAIAGIGKKLMAHVGRHSYGRMLAENGMDTKKAQKLLGHRDERSMRIYFHLLDTGVDKEVDDN